MMKKVTISIIEQWKSTKLLDLILLSNYTHKEIVGVLIDNKIYDIRDHRPDNYHSIYFIERNDPQGEDIIRHSMAHILAEALIQLYPQVQIIIGPTTANGFFYDIDLDHQLNFDDLKKIEDLMKIIINENKIIDKKTIDTGHAIEKFIKKNQNYKVNIIKTIGDSHVTLYSQGTFEDLCRGPHVYSTGVVADGFKLYNISQVDWNPKSKEEKNRIQRIYGYGFESIEGLQNYFISEEEKKKYDHRKIGVDQGLFSFQSQYCSGGVFWEKNGLIIYNELINYIRKTILSHGYFEVKTPNIYNENLWKLSGHWDYYQENIFKIPLNKEEINDSYQYLSLKPMNCPAHILLFKNRLRSYKDLPLRMSEFGCCSRFESSGSLDGIMRMREFIQDDAHIFCRNNQIEKEVIDFCNLLKIVYAKLGFNDIRLVLSTRPQKSYGDDQWWYEAESSLKNAIEKISWDYLVSPGDGAFYGPKLEFSLKDKLGRYWQCGTFQVDFVLPQRMNATYINENSQEEYPVICHRAILGSLERFLGVMIENNKGYWPFWLCPVQIVILNIGEDQIHYGEEIYKMLDPFYRVEYNKAGETLGKKIKIAIQYKIPLMIIIGKQEMENNTIMIRDIKGNSIVINKNHLLQEIYQFIKTYNIDDMS